jgi:DegV family protein with EDD domain
MAFEIITDTGSDLNNDSMQDFGLHVLPLPILVDGKEYQSFFNSEEEIQEFYHLLRKGAIATTSMVNIELVVSTAKKILDAGNDVLYLCFSSGLSNTYEAVAAKLAEVQTEYPLRKIECIDTLCPSGGESLLTHYAVNLQREGKEVDEVAEWCLENRLHIAHWFTVDDLMFLHRGGRVSKTSAIAGTVLGVKPVLHVDDKGCLILVEKAKSRRKSLKALIDHMDKSAISPLDDQIIYIGHGDCKEDAEFIANAVRERFNPKEIHIDYTSPVIGAHSGPGTIALFFLCDKR